MLLLSLPCAASEYGGASTAFLELAPEAGGAGMGSARVSLADGGAAGFWNPAGLVYLSGRRGIAAYRTLSLDRSLNLLGYSQRVEPSAGFGVLWIAAGAGDLVGRDINGRRTGDLSYSENAFCFSFARSLTPRIALGLTMRYLYHTLEDATAQGSGVDIGMLYRPTDRLSFGAILRNAAARLSWKVPVADRETTTEEHPPRTFVCGVSRSALSDRLTLAADVQLRSGIRADLHAGCAATLGSATEIMAGLARPAGHEGFPSVSFGVGLRPLPMRDIWFRYAYAIDALDAGASHAFSTAFGF